MLRAAQAIARGRAAAGALMVDACTIRRPTGKVTDPETGHVTPAYTTIYTGKCRVQQQSGISRPNDVGQALVWMQRVEVQLPTTVTGINVDDQVVITASVLDADLVGRVFHVRELGHKTHVTARRIQAEEING